MTTSPSVGPGNPNILPPHRPLPLYDTNDQAHRAFLRPILNDTAANDDCIDSVPAFGTGPEYTATRTA